MGRPAGIAITTAAALTAALALAPTAAGAPSVTLDRGCYAQGDMITQNGTGFAPGANVVETVSFEPFGGGDPLGSLLAPAVSADASGAFERRISAPGLRKASHRRERAVSEFADQALPGSAAEASWTLSAWGIEVTGWPGGRGKRGRALRVDTWGWAARGRVLRAHYFRKGAHVKTVRIGRLKGACRDLDKEVRQFDFAGARPGDWKVYFSATRRLDRQADAWFLYKVALPPSKKK
jgi:hypothetical protein